MVANEAVLIRTASRLFVLAGILTSFSITTHDELPHERYRGHRDASQVDRERPLEGLQPDGLVRGHGVVHHPPELVGVPHAVPEEEVGVHLGEDAAVHEPRDGGVEEVEESAALRGHDAAHAAEEGFTRGPENTFVNMRVIFRLARWLTALLTEIK